MGERELILDGMSVEEVMRILGAAAAAAKDTGSPSHRRPEPREPAPTTTARADNAPVDSPDWRAILQAIKAGAARSWRETRCYAFFSGLRDLLFRNRR